MTYILAILLVLFPVTGCSQSNPVRVGKPTYPAQTIWLACHGDSITYGETTTDPATKAYPYLVYNEIRTANPSWVWGYGNYGITGQGFGYVYPYPPSNTFGNLTQDAVTRIDPILTYSGTKYLVIFAGTNDIFLNGRNAAQTWALLQTYLNARISAGWTPANICVGTMLPRQSLNESIRTTYNASIRSNVPGMGCKVCDFAANATMGEAGDENNTTYYSDTIHPTDAGQAILAQIVKDTLFP